MKKTLLYLTAFAILLPSCSAIEPNREYFLSELGFAAVVDRGGSTEQQSQTEQQPQEQYQYYQPPQPLQEPLLIPPEPPKSLRKEIESVNYYVTGVGLDTNILFVVSLPVDSEVEIVESLESEKPFMRTEYKNIRYAYSAFVAKEGESPETTAQNVPKDLGFEEIYDTEVCETSLPNTLCYQYRAFNKSKQRYYLGRVYVVRLEDGISVGHSLIVSTQSDSRLLENNRFLSSFYMQSKEVIAQCSDVVQIMKEENQNSSDPAETSKNVIRRIEELEPINSDIQTQLVDVREAFMLLKQLTEGSISTDSSTVFAEFQDNIYRFDKYCYGS